VIHYFERVTVAYSHLLAAVSAEQISAGVGFLF
jgi:hypothetical protein